ncbi:MAG: hypothetical protein CMB80_04750, partial [Flammeovirgaceae bacterium]|nr:hypothetical protein [Flammeovirgaceae bacterium]
IYEDRISQADFNATLKKAIKASKKSYDKMSTLGIQHVKANYNFDKYEKSWVKTMDEIIEKYGAWENRKGHERWHLMEVA